MAHLFADLNMHLVHFGSVLFWVRFLLKWIRRHLPECDSSFSEMSLSHFYMNCDYFVTVTEVFSHAGFTGAKCHLMSPRVVKSYFKWGGKFSVFKGVTGFSEMRRISVELGHLCVL